MFFVYFWFDTRECYGSLKHFVFVLGFVCDIVFVIATLELMLSRFQQCWCDRSDNAEQKHDIFLAAGQTNNQMKVQLNSTVETLG